MIAGLNPVHVLVAANLLLAACGAPEPLRIGYVGGLTGRTADLGTGGRNGIQMAVDRVNAAGGIKGRRIELILQDDANDPEQARHAVQDLVERQVVAILGPMTSNVAVAVAPQASRAEVLMVGGSVTTNDLTGKDDQFFRAIADSTAHAATMAAYLAERRGIRRVHAAVNFSNRAYAKSWIDNFEQAFTARGGRVERCLSYTSAADTDFAALTRQLLSATPEAVILVTNAVDAVLFANQARLLGSKALMVTTEWAGTGKLIELGGGNVEGYIVPQYLDPQNASAEFSAFRAAYRQRFQQEVGFPAVVAYNAAQVVFKALAEQKPGEHLKQTVLRLRRFDGLQEPIVFDDFGDVHSRTFLTEVRNGQYHVVQ